MREAERIWGFASSGIVRLRIEQRPSMEIEFLNGFVVRHKVGLSCTTDAVPTEIVKRVERNELSPDPRHITELRLN